MNLNDLVVTQSPIPSVEQAAAEVLYNVLNMEIDIGDPSLLHYVTLATSVLRNRTIYVTDPTDFFVVYAIANGEVNIAAVFSLTDDAQGFCDCMNEGLLEFFRKEARNK